MPPKKKDNVRDWFSKEMTTEERIKARKILVPHPQPVEDYDTLPCDECDGTGECFECGGEGFIEHYCDCEFCDTDTQECEECKILGECNECDGTGLVSINEPDNDPTKY